VVLRDDRHRTLYLNEIVNPAGDLGAAARSTDRKANDLAASATAIGGERGPYRVVVAWLFVDNDTNRRLVAAYPEFLRTRFRGSSALMAAALTRGTEPPAEPAMAWIDPQAGRIYPMRFRERRAVSA
jgi:hypothetical protein